MATLVLIPLKAPSEAKERLAPILSPSERRQLAIATVRTVVAATTAAGLEYAILTANSSTVDDIIPGAPVIEESPELHGLNAQLTAALASPRLASFHHALILHADLPLATAANITSFASTAALGRVSLLKSTDGGTNALLTPLPLYFPLCYGRDSFALHHAAAERAHLAVIGVDIPALALDLDTPADLAALLATEEGRATPAGQLLLQWDLPERLART